MGGRAHRAARPVRLAEGDAGDLPQRTTPPGAQLRLTDANGLRITAFATNTRTGQLPDLELRHRRRARAEDRIRVAKDTGVSNLPLHGFAQNQICCAVVALAAELTAWTQMLAFPRHEARRWEPKRLRLRLFTIPPCWPVPDGR
jgi:Transposase DDE domain group 1